MVLSSGIAKVSVELKSTSAEKKLKSYAQISGYKAEVNVIRLLALNSWSLCFQRLKTQVAEVDLIFIKNDQVLLIEVKTLVNRWSVFERVSLKQRHKLHKNLNLFANKFKDKNIKAYVAWVSKKNEVSFCEIN